ncbi:unnamed protein product, partial [Tuber aestivum]
MGAEARQMSGEERGREALSVGVGMKTKCAASKCGSSEEATLMIAGWINGSGTPTHDLCYAPWRERKDKLEIPLICFALFYLHPSSSAITLLLFPSSPLFQPHRPPNVLVLIFPTRVYFLPSKV